MNSPLTSASASFDVHTHHYTLGPTVGLRLPYHFAVVADLLYKHLEYSYSRPALTAAQITSTVKISRWELPMLLKYTFAGQRFHPYVCLGGSFNRVVHIEGNNVAELRHRHTRGLVIGTGIEKRFGWLHLAPEIRLTHWADRNFGVHDAPLRSNLNQVELLFGVTF